MNLSDYKLGFAFNGGKESTVVLHMVKHLDPIPFIVKSDHDFHEIKSFVKSSGLNVIEYNNEIEAIQDLIKSYGVNAIVMGCRRTDPKCSDLNEICYTDGDYPKIIRINPLLDWSYDDVWSYIDRNNIEVCDLYKDGYTSIGNITNTFPNYTLFNGSGYDHAKYLTDGELERVGRIKSKLPIKFESKVIHGLKRGREIGFPTANVNIKLDIDNGVYYGTSILEGKKYNMVMSKGENIHFDQTETTVEVHLLEYENSDYFYGKNIKVKIVGYIRPMLKLDTLSSLIERIRKDIEIANYHLSD